MKRFEIICTLVILLILLDIFLEHVESLQQLASETQIKQQHTSIDHASSQRQYALSQQGVADTPLAAHRENPSDWLQRPLANLPPLPEIPRPGWYNDVEEKRTILVIEVGTPSPDSLPLCDSPSPPSEETRRNPVNACKRFIERTR
jgi:hypothetical protein